MQVANVPGQPVSLMFLLYNLCNMFLMCSWDVPGTEVFLLVSCERPGASQISLVLQDLWASSQGSNSSVFTSRPQSLKMSEEVLRILKMS